MSGSSINVTVLAVGWAKCPIPVKLRILGFTELTYPTASILARARVNHMALGWGKCPFEVKNMIIEHLMTSKGDNHVFPCLTNRAFKPGIAVQALRVNRHFYAEGIARLHLNNSFVFDHFATDLLAMTKMWNTFRGECPTFGEVTLVLGDHNSPSVGGMKAASFATVLERLDTPLRTRSLKIILYRHCFNSNPGFRSFTSGLRNVKVDKQLSLTVLPMGVAFKMSNLARLIIHALDFHTSEVFDGTSSMTDAIIDLNLERGKRNPEARLSS